MDRLTQIATRTGESIAKAAAGLKLVISGKSRAVFNRPGVAKQVAEQLQMAGVPVKAASITKDLGIGTAACGAQRVTKYSTERNGRPYQYSAKQLKDVHVYRSRRRCAI